jgi:molybdopterin/thiamine biosynthesis adenylyltransferase
MLSQEELERYSRQIMINGFGEEGQAKLKEARVLIAGAGGLGSATATYLAAAGVGWLRVVDHDRVELSNLNRQVLHRDEDIGKNKVDSAAKRLGEINPNIKIEAIAETITEDNISRLAADCDLIVDAMDNLPARYLLNRAAIEKKIPFFHGAVSGFEGRAMTIIPGRTACLRCVYRGAVVEGSFPVVGVSPGVIGCIQATEVIKYIVGMGQLLTDWLLVYDGLNMKFTQFKVKRDPDCPDCGDL